jgi:hypothetical protein
MSRCTWSGVLLAVIGFISCAPVVDGEPGKSTYHLGRHDLAAVFATTWHISHKMNIAAYGLSFFPDAMNDHAVGHGWDRGQWRHG